MNRIKLYHSGFYQVENPDIHFGRKNADFGQGFYLSDYLQFSLRWTKHHKGKTSYLNIYELDLSDLKILKFERDEKWFSYLSGNRKNKQDIYADYDLIIGPIANDTLFDTFGILNSGLLKDNEAVRLLMIGPEYRQYVIKSEKALHNLKYLETNAIEESEADTYALQLSKETEAFQEEFGKMLEKIMEEQN